MAVGFMHFFLVCFPEPETFPLAAAPTLGLLSFLHAVVFGHSLAALIALDGAAPVKLAVAAGHHLSPALLYSQATLPTEPLAAPLLPLAQVLALLDALAPFGARQA